MKRIFFLRHRSDIPPRNLLQMVNRHGLSDFRYRLITRQPCEALRVKPLLTNFNRNPTAWPRRIATHELRLRKIQRLWHEESVVGDADVLDRMFAHVGRESRQVLSPVQIADHDFL